MNARKLPALLLALFLLCAALPIYANAYAATVLGVVYEDSDVTDENGRPYIQVIGYHGGYKYLDIPAEIDGQTVKFITECAFAGNTKVMRVNIPDTVTDIAKEAFANCPNLVSVTLPSSLTMLNEGTFRGCTLLHDITLPETLENIDDFCFDSCTMLGKIKIPASVTRIGHDAFMTCENLVLDCTENDYAVTYAADYFLPTTNEESRDAAYHTMIAITFVMLIVVFAAELAWKIIKRRRQEEKEVETMMNEASEKKI